MTTPGTRCPLTAHHRVTGPDRGRHVPRRRRRSRHPRLDADRQRDGVHHPVLRRQGRPQRPGARAAPPRASSRRTGARTIRRPRAKSSGSSRPSRTGSAPSPPSPPPRPAPGPPRRLHQRLQPPAAAPLPAAPRDPGHRLRRPAQSHPRRPRRRHPRPGPHRQDQQIGNVTLRNGGRLHHIGVGRTYAGTRVLLLVQDLHVRVINAATGELLRELTLDPTGTTSPPDSHPAPKRKHPEPDAGSRCPRCLATSHW